MSNFIEFLNQHRVIPVVRVEAVWQAEQVTDALLQGGLPIAEITLRSDCAIEAIRSVADRNDLTIGAGTVLNAEQCAQALDAGAKFVVSPGLDRGVVELCLERNIPCFPGVATPTEIQTALNYGLSTVKFFPAEVLGGVPTLKALAGPFRQVWFIPTGGINASNARKYLNLPNVIAVGGSWMITNSLSQKIDVAQIAKSTANMVQIIRNMPRNQEPTM